jgi:hypothetical protein
VVPQDMTSISEWGGVGQLEHGRAESDVTCRFVFEVKERVARRRGKKTALVALARKLLTIAFHLLQERTTFDPQRLRCPA